MNNKIQEAIDLIKSMFTKRLGEIGVYAAADLVLNIVASIPMFILGGMSILSLGRGGSFNLDSFKFLFSSDTFNSGFDLSMLGQVFAFLGPMLIGILITLLLMVFVVQPILTIVRLTFITSTVDNLSENINLAMKNVGLKIAKMILLFVIMAAIYVVIGIVVLIIAIVFGLLTKLIGFVAVILLWLVLIAIGIGLVYFLVPVTIFAPFDAMLTDKPVMTCIMDAFNAKAFRLPMLLVMFVVGILSGIVTAIFGWIPIPFLGLIVAAAVLFCQTCVYIPYYKEYAGK